MDTLTAREFEVLRMLETGLSNKEIAGKLYISPYTVKNHVHNLLVKLNVSSRLKAGALYRAHIYGVTTTEGLYASSEEEES